MAQPAAHRALFVLDDVLADRPWPWLGLADKPPVPPAPPAFGTTAILLPMMLSPAVVGVFWTYLLQPQIGIVSYIVNAFYEIGPLDMIGSVQLAPWAIILVDTWMWTPYVMFDLPCRAALDPRLFV